MLAFTSATVYTHNSIVYTLTRTECVPKEVVANNSQLVYNRPFLLMTEYFDEQMICGEVCLNYSATFCVYGGA